MAQTRKNLRNRRRSRKQRGGADCPKGMPPTQCKGWLERQAGKAAREANKVAKSAAFNKNAPLSKEEINRRIATMHKSENFFKNLKKESNNNNEGNENNVHTFNENEIN